MQSDSQSVGNGAINQHVRSSFCPEKVRCETAVSGLRVTGTFLRYLCKAVPPFSRCPVAGNHLQYLLFRSNWVKYDYNGFFQSNQ